MIEALIFDMDGVLIDSMHLHSKAWKTAFMEVGISIDERDIFSLEGENDPGIIKRILTSSGNDADRFDELMESVPSRKHELFDRDAATMFNGLDECLKTLKRRFRLAVVSGSDRTVVEMMIERYFPGSLM